MWSMGGDVTINLMIMMVMMVMMMVIDDSVDGRVAVAKVPFANLDIYL